MPDELDRVVDARIEAFRPGATPSFTAIERRKRRRDQRRAAAGAALPVLAVAGVAFVSTAVGRGDGGARVADQVPAVTDYLYRISWGSSPDAYSAQVLAALNERCLRLPGVSDTGTLRSLPPILGGRLSGRENVDAFRDCVSNAAPGADLQVVEVEEDLDEGEETSYTLRPAVVRPQDPAVADAVERCLALPGVSGSSVEESDPPTYGATVRRDAAEQFEDCARDIPLYTTELARRPDSGTLTLAQMQALRDRISAERKELEAAGVTLVHWGPSAARRQVVVGVASDLVASEKALRDRYGDDVYVVVAETANKARVETDPEQAAPAVWEIDPRRPPQQSDRSFIALVARLGCSSGVTGKVLPPQVVESEEKTVITFTVAPKPDGGLCPANDRVAYAVTLQAPLGTRPVLDGTCDAAPARTTSACLAPQRWPLNR